MDTVTPDDLHDLYTPDPNTHKGNNGRLLLIGGSHLFHAASLWSLTVASRIVDLVHYASIPENNEIVQNAKDEFRNGIVIPRGEIESYIEEDDVILIGPGMVRAEGAQVSRITYHVSSIKDVLSIEDEGVLTGVLTNYLLQKYPHKQWVIDAGALQMVAVELIPKGAILTPHEGEMELLWKKIQDSPLRQGFEGQARFKIQESGNMSLQERVICVSRSLSCIVLLKGVVDIAANSDGEVRTIEGGNAGMTKGGTGDVLAGLIAALSTRNDPFLATIAGSLINKRAGDELFESVGSYFNASDLADQIPKTMHTLLG